jgi:predicted transposase/invertase (TIGR01784 family)
MKRHIRFDWAAKKILRDKKNFGILEGFLSELLKEDIKIEGILEGESNQEHEKDKFNRVDLLAENSKGELIIIEIQNTREWDYLQRMLFATSKSITEHIDEGDSYQQVKKVIAVSIVYFELGEGDDYLYVGQTRFNGYHNHQELQLTPTQQQFFGKPGVHKVYPEYYLIRTKNFHNVINEPLDEWIYFFKNSEVLDSFKAKGIAQVRKKLAVMNMSEEERKQYKRYLTYLHDEASYAETVKFDQKLAIEEAVKEERELREKVEESLRAERVKGQDELLAERKKVALAGIKMGLTNEQVAGLSGFTVEEVAEMRAKV